MDLSACISAGPEQAHNNKCARAESCFRSFALLSFFVVVVLVATMAVSCCRRRLPESQPTSAPPAAKKACRVSPLPARLLLTATVVSTVRCFALACQRRRWSVRLSVAITTNAPLALAATCCVVGDSRQAPRVDLKPFDSNDTHS